MLRPSLNNVPVNPFERMMQTPQDAAVFALVVMLAGGVREEVQRGFIVRRFDGRLADLASSAAMSAASLGRRIVRRMTRASWD